MTTVTISVSMDTGSSMLTPRCPPPKLIWDYFAREDHPVAMFKSSVLSFREHYRTLKKISVMIFILIGILSNISCVGAEDGLLFQDIAQVQSVESGLRTHIFRGSQRQKRTIKEVVEQDIYQINCNMTLLPDELEMYEAELMAVNYSVLCTIPKGDNSSILSIYGLNLRLTIDDETIATIEEGQISNFTYLYENSHSIPQQTNESQILTDKSIKLQMSYQATGNLRYVSFSSSLSIRGHIFGLTNIEFRIRPLVTSGIDDIKDNITTHRVAVIKDEGVINTVFLIVLGVLIVIYNFGFGCKVKAPLILAIVKRPVAPAIGFCCQFLIMAPLSFGIAKLFQLSDAAGLGLLAIGSSPGGGGSNVFAYLLHGDLELSITMTFISTIGSLGMTPLWIWGLGRFFIGSGKFTIPIANVFSSLAIVTVPVIIGLIITKFKPKVGEKIAWCLKPFTAIIGIFFIAVGTYVYLPSLERISWRTLLACLIVPILGYTIGAVVGKIFRQPRARWITISLETGFQNFALSLFIIQTSLDPPESDLAGVIPITYNFLSAAMPSITFIILCLVKLRRGEKPWAKSESRDLSPLHRNMDDPGGSPVKDHDSNFGADDSESKVATIAAKYNFTELTNVDVKTENGTVINKSSEQIKMNGSVCGSPEKESAVCFVEHL